MTKYIEKLKSLLVVQANLRYLILLASSVISILAISKITALDTKHKTLLTVFVLLIFALINAISYLVISIFPLIPGAGVYYSVSYAVQGDMAAFASRGMHTAAIAGIMAVGILIASTTVRIISDRVSRVRHR